MLAEAPANDQENHQREDEQIADGRPLAAEKVTVPRGHEVQVTHGPPPQPARSSRAHVTESREERDRRPRPTLPSTPYCPTPPADRAAHPQTAAEAPPSAP